MTFTSFHHVHIWWLLICFLPVHTGSMSYPSAQLAQMFRASVQVSQLTTHATEEKERERTILVFYIHVYHFEQLHYHLIPCTFASASSASDNKTIPGGTSCTGGGIITDSTVGSTYDICKIERVVILTLTIMSLLWQYCVVVTLLCCCYDFIVLLLWQYCDMIMLLFLTWACPWRTSS